MNDNKIEKSYELIKFEDGDFSLDVNVSPSEDTVWLTQAQIAELYERARNTITEHINNIINENELELIAVSRKIRHTASDGKTYDVVFYNLDMILSVGYRVKSKRGNMFRRWANSILKQYLLKGYVINEPRCMAHSDSLIQINNEIDKMNNEIDKVNNAINQMNFNISDFNNRLINIELKVDDSHAIEIFKNRIIYDNQLFEGYSFIKNLFNKANNRIIIIDSYLDYSVLEMLNDINIDITIYIDSHTPITNREILLFQNNHNLNVIRTNKYHDRFIIIDDELYSIGSSIKDIGKRISQISKLESINIDELLNRY